jgi:ribosomal-protein-alanine N-acetyltransferase
MNINPSQQCRRPGAKTEVQVRAYESHDFKALHKLDQSCFPPGIAYSNTMLRYFLTLSSAECLLAADGKDIGGFILSSVNAPLAHIVTLDVAQTHRRSGIGSMLLNAMEKKVGAQGVHTVLLETAVDNQAAVAFWQRHGYRIEGVMKRYYLGRTDAYEMRKLLPFPQKP